MNATDPDEGSAGQVTYSPSTDLVPTPSQFSINPLTGDLCVISRLDRDAGQEEYNFAVRATDGGGLMSHAFVRVILEDINDNVPVFTSLNYRGTVSSIYINLFNSSLAIARNPDCNIVWSMCVKNSTVTIHRLFH